MRRRWKLANTLLLAVALLAWAGPSAVLAAPTNDYFSNATIVASLPFNTVVDTTGSSTEFFEPQPCNFMSQTLWYSFTPGTTTVVTIDTSGTAFPTQINVYQAFGPGLSGLSFLACS